MNSANDGTENEPVVLYEDDALVAINKPAGLIVHYDGRTPEPSVADWFVARYPQARDVGEPWTSPQGVVVARSGIVHRLDRTTSGVLILAKTQAAFEALKAQFQARTVEKTYDALVYDHPKADTGIIDAEIGRTKTKPRRWTAQFGKRGFLRAAITHWRVLARYEDTESGQAVTHMELSPKTGRTHQLRVHCKAIHHPLVCDALYAPKRPCILGFERPALHARAIAVVSPATGERIVIEAPLPCDFSDARKRLKTAPAVASDGEL